MVDSRVGEEIYKMNLEHLVLLENNNVLIVNQPAYRPTNQTSFFCFLTVVEVGQRSRGGNFKGFQWPKLGLFYQANHVIGF